MRARELFELLKETYRQWSDDRTSQLGAALAYYTIFSLAPMLVIAIAVASLVFGEEAARDRVADELSRFISPAVARAVADMIERTRATGSGTLAAVVSIAVMLCSATAVFGQLQSALNTIWGVQSRPDRGWLGMIRDRFLSFLAVLGIGLLLLLSLMVSTVLSALSGWLAPEQIPGGATLWHLLDVAVSVGLFTLLFAMIYKLLPDIHLAWRDVWIGAVVTALLFTAGKYLIGLYLGRGSVASAYGAAGSLVLLLLWVYYSSQILLFGAEFTYVCATRYGRPMVDTERAEPVTAEARARQGMKGVKPAVQPAPLTRSTR